MYFNYYGLKEKPFSLSADPRYLYYSRSHKEALAQMIYAASEDSGFLILTGEVGTGKTIMINALTDRLPDEYRVAKIFHTALDPEGLIQNICKEFKIGYTNKSLSQLILKLQDFLKWTDTAGKRSILILDEAQNLTAATLEEVRLLSNFEAAHKKVLQIFLVGQPELEEKLWKNDLRQLRERISLKSRLQKLDRSETAHYIARRLAVAGHGNTKPIFTEEAVDAIYDLSTGVPRRINILCENALLLGYADNYKLIYEDVVKKVGAYNQHESRVPEFSEEASGSTPPLNPTVKKSVQSSSVVHNVGETRLPGSNGHMDYQRFQNYMQNFLGENGLSFRKSLRPGHIILGLLIGFILIVLAFLTAFIIATKSGLIN